MLQVLSGRLGFPPVQYQWNSYRNKSLIGHDKALPKTFQSSGWSLDEFQAFHDLRVKSLKYFVIQSLRNTGPMQSFDAEVKNQMNRRCGASVNTVTRLNNDTSLAGSDLKTKMEQASNSGAQLVVLMIPSFDRFIYREFKDLADRSFGLRSLCLAKPEQFGSSKYMSNVAQKLNTKFGGVNSSVDGMSKFLGKNTLVLGADLVHPSAGAFGDMPSIACIVGSIDNQGGTFPGSAQLQSKDKDDREVSYIIP
jgi:hypothetical protein